jgi:hypothetical protein
LAMKFGKHIDVLWSNIHPNLVAWAQTQAELETII